MKELPIVEMDVLLGEAFTLNLIIESLQKNKITKEKDWLEKLIIYECPTCKQETIFKSGCMDCEEKND